MQLHAVQPCNWCPIRTVVGAQKEYKKFPGKEAPFQEAFVLYI